jgi:hypothetical protein
LTARSLFSLLANLRHMLRALAVAQKVLMELSIAVAHLLVAADVAEDAVGAPDEVAVLYVLFPMQSFVT